jgi:hypothetical protein
MTEFPGPPRLLKGAIVGLDPANPLASIIVFQYNPERMTRRLDARSMGDQEGDSTEVYRLIGPPKETISLTIEVDAADQLERGDPLAAVAGIYPALSALEMLLYPKSKTVIKNIALSQVGNIEIIPPEAPLTLFVWGPQRVLPVRLTSLSITELAYNPLLHPIRGEVELSLLVLSYHDFKVTQLAHGLFLAHQISKEIMATSYVTNSAQNLGASLNII